MKEASISVRVGNLMRCVLKCYDGFVVHKMLRSSSIFFLFLIDFFWCNAAGELVKKKSCHIDTASVVLHSPLAPLVPVGIGKTQSPSQVWSGIFFLTWSLILEDFKAFMETGCYTTAQENLCQPKQKLLISLRKISLIMVIVECSDCSIMAEIPNRKILFVRLQFYTDSTCKWETDFSYYNGKMTAW